MSVGFIGNLNEISAPIRDRSLEWAQHGFKMGAFQRSQALNERKQTEEEKQNTAQRQEWTAQQKFRDAQLHGLEQAQALNDIRLLQEQQKLDNSVRWEGSKAQFFDAMKGIDENGWWGKKEGMMVMHDLASSMPWITEQPEWSEAMKYHETAAKSDVQQEIATARLENALAIKDMQLSFMELANRPKQALQEERLKLEELRVKIGQDRLDFQKQNNSGLSPAEITMKRADKAFSLKASNPKMTEEEIDKYLDKYLPYGDGGQGGSGGGMSPDFNDRYELDPNSPTLMPMRRVRKPPIGG